MSNSITAADIERYQAAYDSDSNNEVKANAIIKNGITASALNQAELKKFVNAYSINVESGDVCNQKRSGRCWMFAAMNVMRLEVMKKLNIKNMELSQNYTLFWDKIEKSNFFLENILKTLDEPVGSRLLDFLLSSPIGDGGQWTMIVNLVKKYGVCPKDVYPESACSSNTTDLDKYITLKLREDACTLRKAHEAGKSLEELRTIKDQMLSEIYRILCLCLGVPPKTFTWEYVDAKNEYHAIKDITPKAFFDEYVGMKLDDYVSILNCPSPKRPLNHLFTVKYLNNVEGGAPVLYLNLPIERVKELAVNQLKDNEVVWFGSDVAQFSTRDSGIMATEAFDVDKLLGVTFGMDKGERVDYGESLMTHAMVLTGVNLDENGKPTRWKVENSWGDVVGYKGYFAMSDKWFSEFTYQAVIEKKYLTAEELALLNEKPIELEPWDPMGSLAF